MSNQRKLLVVSNRLPITLETNGNGRRLRRSGGGLVSALAPILEETRGCWIGWTGSDCDDGVIELLRNWESSQKHSFIPVSLSAAEIDTHYRGFSNQIIWPLFHSLSSRCLFDSLYWEGYCAANEKFAEAVERVSTADDFIWVHDYHLMILGQALRRRGVRSRLAYFHHIPFPSPDIFETLPWRVEVLRALMRFDMLGFQTKRDRCNFAACVRRCLRGARIYRVDGRFFARAEGQSVSVGIHPISIDFDSFETQSAECETIATSESIRRGLAGVKIILGVDRLDYTKGIPERLRALQHLLEMNPGLRGKVTLLQIVVPSREDIPEYKQLQGRIETLVSKINGEFSTAGWVPIHYFYRSVS